MSKMKWAKDISNRKLIPIIFAIVFIFWGGVIFYFSSKPPEVSSMQSHFMYKVLKKIDSVIDFSSTQLFQKIERKVKMWWFKTQYVPAEMLIRKTAHFGLYFIFGLLSVSFFYVWKKDIIIASLLGVSLPGLLAIFDEYNQLFYRRGSSLNDVVIDVSGAFFGVFLFLVLIGLFKLFKGVKALLSERR